MGLNHNSTANFIFPNPAKNIISISNSDQLQNVEVYDITGKLLISTSEKNIEINQIKSGIYIIKCYFTDNQTQQKFIKE